MADEPTAFDFKPAYKVAGHEGIAWRVTGYVKILEGVWEDDEFYDEWEEDDTTRVVAHMIGDDRDFEFDITDLTPLEEDEYCGSCGQVGCGWH